MGKIIQFPFARMRLRRRQAAAVFADFSELAMLERAQLRLLGACAGCATLLTAALQLAAS